MEVRERGEKKRGRVRRGEEREKVELGLGEMRIKFR